MHQMISAQPPIRMNTSRARKGRKSFHSFAFGGAGGAKIVPGGLSHEKEDNDAIGRKDPAKSAQMLLTKIRQKEKEKEIDPVNKKERIFELNPKLSNDLSSQDTADKEGKGLGKRKSSIRFEKVE